MGTLTFFFLNHFLGEEQFWYFNFFLSLSFFGRNSSEISLRGWHLVIFRAEQSKKPPCSIQTIWSTSFFRTDNLVQDETILTTGCPRRQSGGDQISHDVATLLAGVMR